MSDSNRLILSGNPPTALTLPTEQSITSAWGDHNGPHAFLTRAGSTHLLTSPPALSPAITSPSLAHTAITGADRVAAIPLWAPGSTVSHVLEFATPAAFTAWLHDPSDTANYPAAHHMVSGRARTLKAFQTGFVMLTEAGEVYTWGDARHADCLGRIGEGDGVDEPAGRPGVVGRLAGLKVVKVDACSGGWVTAAVTDAGWAVLWGRKPGGVRGEAEEIKDLADAREAGEIVASIDLGEGGEDEVVDIAVGAGHVLVLDGKGAVWSAGEGLYGQLGTGGSRFKKMWQRVVGLEALAKAGKEIVEVACGDLDSFIVLRTP